MKSSFSIFRKKMRDLRRSTHYEADLLKFRQYLDIQEDICLAQIEALIIKATKDVYHNDIEADMVLAALGLLEGFDNHCGNLKTDDARKLLTDRRIKFLKESNYIYETYNGPNARRYKGHYNSYEEVENAGKDALKIVLSTLGSNDGDSIDKVAKELYLNAASILDYINNHEEDYFIKYNDKIRTRFAKIIHVRQDFPEHSSKRNFTTEPLPGEDDEIDQTDREGEMTEDVTTEGPDVTSEIDSSDVPLSDAPENEGDLKNSNLEQSDKEDEITVPKDEDRGDGDIMSKGSGITTEPSPLVVLIPPKKQKVSGYMMPVLLAGIAIGAISVYIYLQCKQENEITDLLNQSVIFNTSFSSGQTEAEDGTGIIQKSITIEEWTRDPSGGENHKKVTETITYADPDNTEKTTNFEADK